MTALAEPPPPTAVLSYHAMRLRWCRLALLDFLRRWGVYVAVAVLVVGAGTVSAVQIVLAAASWVVLPLFWAAAHGAWLVPALTAQALLGLGAVWALRPLLWPTAWAESERALPLPAAVTRSSDRRVVALALLPLFILEAIGAAVLIAHDPPWLHPVRGRAGVALAVAALASLALGVQRLQALRRAPRARAARPAEARDVATYARRSTSTATALPSARPTLHWTRALLWLPLQRGAAPRSAHGLLLAIVALAAPAPLVIAWPALASWLLAAWALLALTAAARIDRLTRDELLPQFDACASLPLARRALDRARVALVLAPLPPLLALLAAALPSAGLRPGVLAAYALACLACAAVEVTLPPADPSAQSGRWMFMLVVCVCLASEVYV